MKAEFLNPFLISIANVIEATISQVPEKGKPFLRDRYPYKTSDVAIIVGLTGNLAGQIVVSMDTDCAKGIAAVMLMEPKAPELDEYAQSALAELANMIIANATIGLSDAGYMCEITPPTVITGKSLEIVCQEHIKTIAIPMKLSMGDIEVNLSIAEAGDIKKTGGRK